MFFIRHPKPVVDGRAVATLVVQQKATGAVSRTVLIVDQPPASSPPVALEPEDACPASRAA